jgi:hypothetical protein
MFGKIFEQTFTGSLFGKPPIVFAVWAYIIAHMRPARADGDCYCEVNPALLCVIFSTPLPQVEAALEILEAPDEASRDAAENGRRIVIIGERRHAGPRQYRVVNGARYRATADEDDRREQNREAKARERKRDKIHAESQGGVSERQLPSASVSKPRRSSGSGRRGHRQSAEGETNADEDEDADADAHADVDAEAYEESDAEMTTTGVVTEKEVAFVHGVLTEIAPHLGGSLENVEQWLAIFPDSSWVAAAICESELSLQGGRHPAYILGMLRQKAREGAQYPDALDYVALRLSSRRRAAGAV